MPAASNVFAPAPPPERKTISYTFRLKKSQHAALVGFAKDPEARGELIAMMIHGVGLAIAAGPIAFGRSKVGLKSLHDREPMTVDMTFRCTKTQDDAMKKAAGKTRRDVVNLILRGVDLEIAYQARNAKRRAKATVNS
jgi:hypothetical protein